MRLFFFSCSFLVWSLTVNGQGDLPRRALLGIQPQEVTVAQSIAAGGSGAHRVLVRQVFPGTTAEQLGLESEDIISEINGERLYNNQDLFATLGGLNAGDPIEVQFYRQGKAQSAKGTLQGFPLPAHSSGTITMGAVPFQEGYLRSFLHTPSGVGPFPTIYFLQGYTCGSIEFTQDTHPFNRLIQQFVDAGYAVFRVEKPGVGDCRGTLDCMEIDFPTELSAFEAAYQYLLELPEVDRDAITLYGHSLGGLVAPKLAAKFQPQSVVVFGTLLYSWDDYLLELFRFQWPLEGRDHAEVEAQVLSVKDLYYQYFHEKKAPSELRASPEAMSVFADMMDIRGPYMINRHYTFWQTLNEENFVAAWKAYSGKVLALYGEHDVAALDSDAAQQIISLVNHYHPGQGTFQLVPDTNHSLLLVESKKQSYALNRTGQIGAYSIDHFNQNYAPQILDWLGGGQKN